MQKVIIVDAFKTGKNQPEELNELLANGYNIIDKIPLVTNSHAVGSITFILHKDDD